MREAYEHCEQQQKCHAGKEVVSAAAYGGPRGLCIVADAVEARD